MEEAGGSLGVPIVTLCPKTFLFGVIMDRYLWVMLYGYGELINNVKGPPLGTPSYVGADFRVCVAQV